MRCPSCGKQIPDKSTFCLHCGTQIQAAAAARQSGGVNIDAASDLSVGRDVIGRDKIDIYSPAKVSHQLTISRSGKLLGVLIGLGFVAAGVILLFTVNISIIGWVVIGIGTLWTLIYLATPSG